jgi:hypothetical protein
MNAAELLPRIRNLFSRHPDILLLAPHHLQWVLYALNYTDALEDEHEIAAAAEVARTDWTGRAA